VGFREKREKRKDKRQKSQDKKKVQFLKPHREFGA